MSCVAVLPVYVKVMPLLTNWPPADEKPVVSATVAMAALAGRVTCALTVESAAAWPPDCA